MPFQIKSFGPKGSWALITGASDGIGKQFALQLANAGFNVILVSRTASKLQAVSSEITTSNSGVRSEILAMDFSKNQDSDYDKLAALLKDKDIAILINNVGQSHELPVPYVEDPEEEVRDIITTNCIGTLKVTRLVLPGMAARKRGLVLTMGSFGGLLPTPLLATYSGSKCFLQNWSIALATEVEELGITVYFQGTAFNLLVPDREGFCEIDAGEDWESVRKCGICLLGHAVVEPCSVCMVHLDGRISIWTLCGASALGGSTADQS